MKSHSLSYWISFLGAGSININDWHWKYWYWSIIDIEVYAFSLQPTTAWIGLRKTKQKKKTFSQVILPERRFKSVYINLVCIICFKSSPSTRARRNTEFFQVKLFNTDIFVLPQSSNKKIEIQWKSQDVKQVNYRSSPTDKAYPARCI